MIRFCWPLLLGACASTAPSLQETLDARGVSMSALFAPPSDAELQEVSNDWASRSFPSTNVSVVFEAEAADGRIARVIAHTVDGHRHYGVVMAPADDVPAPVGGFPVVLSFIGFGPPYEARFDPNQAGENDVAVVSLFPSFRGHTLVIGEQRWASEGDAFDQCDGGTDDAIAFFNAALSLTPRASEASVATVGGSRGGNVAMLFAIRDSRVRRAVSFAGPDDYLREDYLDHPNLTILYERWFVADLAGPADIGEARRRMLACSPRYFVDRLPRVQLHHGDADAAVPPGVMARMRAAWLNAGREPEELETWVYEGEDHSFGASVPLLQTRIADFLLPLVAPDA
ncbi:MAG: prolyl oligopeptidase family serine peptidase [Myxococcota bacterium]